MQMELFKIDTISSTEKQICTTCKGEGKVDDSDYPFDNTCPDCYGYGHDVKKCPVCDGESGHFTSFQVESWVKCPHCNEDGLVTA